MNIFSENSVYRKDLEETVKATLNVNTLRNKSILVTGATGLLGSYVIETMMTMNRLLGINCTIYALGRSMKHLNQRFIGEQYSELNLIEQDVSLPLELKLDKIDFIIHAASNADPSSFKKDPTGTILGNVIGTNQLLKWSKEHGVQRFLYISSGEVYGQLTDKEIPFHENQVGYINQLEVRSCYPIAKRTAENLCISFYQQFGLDTVIVRPSHIFGPNFTSSDSRVSAQFFRTVLEDKDIELRSLGKQYRSYCYISDCISAILSVLTTGHVGEAYNCTNTENAITLHGFAERVASFANKIVEFKVDKKQMDTPISVAVLDDTKVKELGWKPRFNLDVGIAHTLKILSEV